MNTDRIYSVLVPLTRPVVAGMFGARRRAYTGALTTPPDRVVFVGDSITQHGIWSELFPELPVVNRGVGGETTSDVLKRLDDAIVQPRAVSLLVGTNDLHGPRARRPVDGIAGRFGQIVRQIRAAAPAAGIFISSVTPRTPLFRSRIAELNERYRHIADANGAAYVDLWPALADAEGGLRSEFTSDNLHLTPAGYLAWRDVLRPHLAPYAHGGNGERAR